MLELVDIEGVTGDQQSALATRTASGRSPVVLVHASWTTCGVGSLNAS